MFKNLLKNKLMLGVFLLVLILQGIITQFGAAVFETVPLSAAMWGKMLLTAFTVIILNEGIKADVYKRQVLAVRARTIFTINGGKHEKSWTCSRL